MGSVSRARLKEQAVFASYACHLRMDMQISCRLVLQLLTVILCLIPVLPQSAEGPASRGELVYKVANWQAGFLTQEDYLLVFISDRGGN